MYILKLKNKEDIRKIKMKLTSKEIKDIKNGIKTKKYYKFYYTTLCNFKYKNGGFDIIVIS